MDSFSAHCLAFSAVITCQIWWKFVNSFCSCSQKYLANFFVERCMYCCFFFYLHFHFVLWRYETDGSVESLDEILSFLSTWDYVL